MDFISILVTIFGILVIGYLLFNILRMNKRIKKNRRYIKIVDQVNNRDIFFDNINKFIETEDNEFKTKGQILKLYGLLVHERYEEIKTLLSDINLSYLMYKDNKFSKELTSFNEDSFYYLLFLCPIKLIKINDLSNIKIIEDKINEYNDVLNNQLFYQIFENSLKMYKFEDDLGYTFFNNFMKGDYTAIYASQMISIYKSVGACFLAKIMILKDISDEDNLITSDVEHFSKSKIGIKIMNDLNIMEKYGAK